MRVVIQRVKQASVSIAGEVCGTIGVGLVVLVGITDGDMQTDIDWLCGKITRLRIFDDDHGVMNLSVQDVKGDILLISQFTLFASTQKGNRPSYKRSARSEVGKPIYEVLRTRLAEVFAKPIKTGKWGANMQISLINDGPVTITLDSKVPE